MSTFGKMATFPTGYFRAYSSWLLRNRRDVVARVQVLSAEINRIGFVRCIYEGYEDEDGNVRRRENRITIAVTEGSSLARLLQAYIALGGNPLDISPFAYPDSTEVEVSPDGTEVITEEYPDGGVVAPRSASYDSPADEPGETGYGASKGGSPSTDRYYPGRMGGKVDRGAFDSNAIVKVMHHIRSWANQDIKERLQDIEWRIIKLADLREQLLYERDEALVQAFGGALTGLPDIFDDDQFMRGHLVQNLIQDMYKLLYETEWDGTVRSFSVNANTGFSYFIVPGEVSEIRDALGG